jgi:hypothetical protein
MADVMAGPGRQPTISDEDILEVFRKAADPFLTTKEVSNELDLGRRGTYDRLVDLADEGRLKRKKVGESAIIWWDTSALEEEHP